MISEKIEIGTQVFHEIYGIGIFRGWWMDRPEYARVEYDLKPHKGNLLIRRKDLTEIKNETGGEKQCSQERST